MYKFLQRNYSPIYDLSSNTFHLRPQKEKTIYIKTDEVYDAWIHLFKIHYKSVFLNFFYLSYH